MQLVAEDTSSNLTALVANGQLPPIPDLTSLNDAPPAESDHIVLGTTDARLQIWANSDNSGAGAWAPDSPNPWAQVGPALLNYWDGGGPAQYTLTMRQYWRQVDGSYTRLPEGNSMSISVTKTYGISTTDSQTLSAELGVEGGGLSAKVTATFSHSVTTTQETSETKEVIVQPPAAGMIRVWLAWQLVNEIVALDASGNIIPTGQGPNGTLNRKAEILWSIKMLGDSGAWVYYQNVQQAFPSTNVVYYQKDFPVH